MKNDTQAVGYDVDVTLDKPRVLRFNWRALMAFERENDLLVSKVLEEGRLGFHTICGFVWAGLLWQDSGLTMDRTAVILQKWVEAGGSIVELWGSIREALRRSKLVTFAEPEESKANGADPDADADPGVSADPTPAPESGSA